MRNLQCVAPGGGGFGGANIGLDSRNSSSPMANAGGSVASSPIDGVLMLNNGGMRSVVSGCFTLIGELTMIGGERGCCCGWDEVKVDGGGGEMFSLTGNDSRSSVGVDPSWSVTGTEQNRTHNVEQHAVNSTRTVVNIVNLTSNNSETSKKYVFNSKMNAETLNKKIYKRCYICYPQVVFFLWTFCSFHSEP